MKKPCQKLFKPLEKVNGVKLHIVEGAESVWHYHLSETGENAKPPLCGKGLMMRTKIPLKRWGQRSHIGETYCKECEEIAENFIKKTKKQ